MTRTVATEIARYLRTGHTGDHHTLWPGRSVLERAQRARDDLRGALIAEVRRRSAGATSRDLPGPEEIVALTRRKVEPMVRGLFPRAEQDAVLALVERSVVFLSHDNIGRVLEEQSFDESAWGLANLYLGDVGAELLGPEAPAALGMSEGTTCYVTPAALDEDQPFADYVVHEVAHIFHNCKRQTAGLPVTRRREWMLDIAFQKRETFAWSCEVFSRVTASAGSPRERRALAGAFARYFEDRLVDEIDPDEVIDIVREASERRNGWKVILARCAPTPRGAGASSGGEG